MQYGCIGEHLPHSFSKIIHNKIGDYDYVLHELTPEEVDPFMRKADFKAINVTIPYKEKVIPYLYEISPSARAIGAVNTIVNRDGKLYGYNTDYMGMNMLAEHAGITFAGKTVLILGSGGTAKTSFAVTTDAGANKVLRVSRTPRDGMISYEEAYGMADDVGIIINTTPCGMFPRINGAAIDLAPFKNLTGVIDAVYNPLKTDLILQAEEMGIPACGGLYMLVAQAVAASEIFMDCRYPASITDSIFREISKSKQNVVLIGMPSSGKTTVGGLIAKKTGLKLVDTDVEITAETGKTPAEIISEDGVAAFRKIESAVIGRLAPLSGMVIATGGGAVLDPVNVKALKKNGVLVWLDRPLEKLLTTSDRPLSNSAEKLSALYAERRPIYEAASDFRAPSEGTPEDVLKILEEGLII